MRVGTHTVLFSGLDEAAPKSEQGVGIVLSDDMYTAWQRADFFASLEVVDYVESSSSYKCDFGVRSNVP